MNPDELKTWMLVILGLWSAGLSIVVWLRKPGEDATAAVNKLREEMTEELGPIKDRLTTIETEIQHMPTSEELAQLEGTVKQIDERTAAQSEQMKSLAAAVNRIETFLLNHK